jgi:hypothetical protein
MPGLIALKLRSWAHLFEGHALVLSLLFVGALATGWLVLPGEDERIAALERDGQMQRALQLLEAQFAHGDRRQRTLFQLQHFYDYYGNVEKSRQMLEMLAALRPRDAYVQRQLAQFYKQTQDEPSYIKALRNQLALRYSEPACRELIGILRRNSEYEGEQKAISDCQAAGYRRPDDIVRLAFLDASDGKLAVTATLLTAVDDRRRLKASNERLLLFSALIETENAEEATRRGVRWLHGQRDNDLALELISMLIQAHHHELALNMAKEVGTPGDPVSLSVGEILIDQGQSEPARSYLNDWLESAKIIDAETAGRFIAAALDVEDVALALRAAKRWGLERLDQHDLSLLAEALSAESMLDEFDRVRVLLRPESLSANPLLAAAVEIRSGHTDAGRVLLARLHREELEEWQLPHWARLTEQAGIVPENAAVVRDLKSERVPIVGPAQAKAKRMIRHAAIKRLRQQLHRRLLQQLPADKPPAPPPASSPQSTSSSSDG